jgi:hypothetical protein
MTGAELDSVDGPEEVGVSVVCGVSAGVVVCSVVVVWASGADEEACVDVAACSGFVASSSPEARDDVEAASGACAGAVRAFEGLDLCTACARFAWWRDRAAFPLVPAPFVAALARVLPGKACAAIAVNAPVSVTLPASSQRLQRDNRCSAASRERLEGNVVMYTYSTPLPSTR